MTADLPRAHLLGRRRLTLLRRLGVALLVLVVAACETHPTPAPSTVETPAPQTGSPATASASQSPQASSEAVKTIPAGPPPSTTTSAQKIRDALAAGTIDGPTSLLYRVYALFGDPRLPEAYRGQPEHDQVAVIEAHDQLDRLPVDIRTQLEPYLLRPSEPGSAWSTEPVASTTSTIKLAIARPAPVVAPVVMGAPACDGTWMHGQVSPNIPVMIWAQCTGDPLAAAASWEEARGYFAVHYSPMTNFMGPPKPDVNVPNDGYADTPETGDGLVDVYLLSAFTPSGHPRTFDYGTSLAVTMPTPAYVGAAGAEAAAAYVVVRPGLRGRALESTLVHEFFHVLQFAHNYRGTYECPVRNLGGCNGVGLEFHWFVEASAKWSEHYFLPLARAELVYPFWKPFVVSPVSLADTVDTNEYSSFAWPLFMQQEIGADSIAAAWRAIEGKKGWRAVQAALDGVLSFKDHFRDFGVRVLNRELLPGDPVQPRFRNPQLDPTFPLDPPDGARTTNLVHEDLVTPLSGPSETLGYRSTVDFLWTSYVPITAVPDAHQMTWDFSTFGPEIDVDAVIRIRDKGWERRKLVQGPNAWCLDKPADAFEEGYLVFSNHDQTPRTLERTWSVVATTSGCGTPVGTLTYSYLDTAPIASLPGGSSAIDASVQVRLKRNNDQGAGYVAEFLNDGSTYGVHTYDKVISPPLVTGCSDVNEATGSPGGGLEIDSVVGTAWIDEDGTNRLTLAIDLPLHVESTLHTCLYGDQLTSWETTVQYPSCDGTETDETESTQTFVFDCDFRGGTASWTISGTIIINR